MVHSWRCDQTARQPAQESGAALAEQQTAPELLAALRAYVITSRRQMLRSIVQEAQARGELALQADTDLAVAQLIGSYYALAIAGEPMPPDWPQRVVDQVLAGIAARQPTQ